MRFIGLVSDIEDELDYAIDLGLNHETCMKYLRFIEPEKRYDWIEDRSDYEEHYLPSILSCEKDPVYRLLNIIEGAYYDRPDEDMDPFWEVFELRQKFEDRTLTEEEYNMIPVRYSLLYQRSQIRIRNRNFLED